MYNKINSINNKKLTSFQSIFRVTHIKDVIYSQIILLKKLISAAKECNKNKILLKHEKMSS